MSIIIDWAYKTFHSGQKYLHIHTLVTCKAMQCVNLRPGTWSITKLSQSVSAVPLLWWRSVRAEVRQINRKLLPDKDN